MDKGIEIIFSQSWRVDLPKLASTWFGWTRRRNSANQ
jgi:hypothetical protein